MKRIAFTIVTVVLTALIAGPGLAQDTRKVLAVVDFEDLVHGWGSSVEVVTTHVINRLREESSVRVLPRDTVQGALRDAKVETRGLLDPADAQKVGQALGANYVLMGQIQQFNWESHSAWVVVAYVTQQSATVDLKGRLVNVATGQPSGQPEGKSQMTTTGGSTWVGPWWSSISVDNFDNALIGKATKDSVDKLVKQTMTMAK